FDPQGGKLVCHYAERPAWCVGAATVAAISENFRRGLGFIARTKRAEARAVNLHLIADKIRRPLGPVRGDDDPTAGNGVFSQFRQGKYSLAFSFQRSAIGFQLCSYLKNEN